MARTVIFEWEGREYDHNPKSADWYWALGIIAIAAAIATLLFGNYLFAVLILVAAVTIALHGAKHPPVHRFRIVEHGLVIGEELYPFEHMISFSVLEDIEGELPPLLSIKNESWLSPHLTIPLSGVDADAVYEHLLHHIDEGAHPHTVTDLMAAWLGF
ncbi:MAG: hypothetical protein WC030_01545 [Candidatus Paceibacterota bacterium]